MGSVTAQMAYVVNKIADIARVDAEHVNRTHSEILKPTIKSFAGGNSLVPIANP